MKRAASLLLLLALPAQAEEPIAGHRKVRPEAWVEDSRYHDGVGVERVTVTVRSDIVARPVAGAQVVGMGRKGETLSVVRMSRDGKWYLIELGGGDVGWIPAASVRAAAGKAAPPAGSPTAPPPPADSVDSIPPPETPDPQMTDPPPKSRKKRKKGVESVPNPDSEIPPPEPPIDETPVEDRKLPGRFWIGARGGIAFIGQRFSSNASGYLTNYDASANAVAVEAEIGFRVLVGRVFLGLDGGYRFAGATGYKVAAPGGELILGAQDHDVQAGATLGVRFEALGGFTASLHLGPRMFLELLELNDKALLPSGRLIAMAAGLRLEAPAIIGGLGARVDAQLVGPGSLAQSGGVGEGATDGLLGFGAAVSLGYRVGAGVSIEAGYRYVGFGLGFEGKAERDKKITKAERSSSLSMITFGITFAR